ncbi:hypothetical protein HS125_07870 [bacterium]|nr:hypothetical protein [bacterium]
MLSLLPGDLEASCEEKLALVRRRRISSAEDLLRLCLGYSLCDMSLRQLAAWSTVAGLGELSDVAILKRLRHASEWRLGHLVLQMLQKRGVTRQVPGCQVRILDATTIQRPGSKGTDLRLHASFDLAGQRLSALELTDASGERPLSAIGCRQERLFWEIAATRMARESHRFFANRGMWWCAGIGRICH